MKHAATSDPADRAHILVVEDEAHLAKGIEQNLRAEGFDVSLCADGEAGLLQAASDAFDLVVLDVMLPRKDGFEVCRETRARSVEVPILFLSARASADERAFGLSLGADDYLGKPFHLAEFLGRVKALLRRSRRNKAFESAAAAMSPIAWAPTGARIDLARAEVRDADGGLVELGPREAAVLRCLWREFGEVVSREALLEAAWGHEVLPSSRVLETIILQLRQRLEPDPEQPVWLVTIRGIGYRLLRP